jgi:hypothetical protein
MAQMGTPIVKRAILPVLSANNKDPFRQVFTFEPYCTPGGFQLQCLTQIDGQLPICIIPAVIYSGFGSRRYTQQSLKKTSFQEFYTHVFLLLRLELLLKITFSKNKMFEALLHKNFVIS